MSDVSASRGCKGQGVARGEPIPNPHPPTGQVHGSGARRAKRGAAVPEQ